jgi:heme exporter protein D
MNEFFAMGGYAFYVWMSYGLTAAALGVEFALLRARRRRTLLEARLAEPEPRITTRAALDPGSLA